MSRTAFTLTVLPFGWNGMTPMGFFGLLYGNIGIGEKIELSLWCIGLIGFGFLVTSPIA